ncbi:MAG: transglutaminase domain-containing protein [Candidatus Ornithomonoglobus sp.]
MILEFTYSMKQTYSLPIVNHHYALKCMPPDTQRQRVMSAQLELFPECSKSYKSDVFGNKTVYGCLREAHADFCACLSGVVETGFACNEHTESENTFFTDIFRCQSAFTRPGSELTRLYKLYGKCAKRLDPYTAALYLMRTVYHTMSYVPGTTDVTTTAEQALLKRRGVCQDYAHILIALCRMAGIPARYVVGMMIGEGASHAWVEVCCNGYWYGLDPTNNLLIDESYIKLSHGRDYADTIVSKGIFHGLAQQYQKISVIVKPK